MPRLRTRTRLERREWNHCHRTQLETGWDFFHGAWGDSVSLRRTGTADGWPTPEVVAEMKVAWSELRDEIMAKYIDTLRRPWAWWVFEHDQPMRGSHFYSVNDEAETLDLMGELTPAALAKAAADGQVTRGVHNDAWEPPFRRRWGWWRFTSPQCRDRGTPEAVQLVNIERRGGEVLTRREQYIVEHRIDDPSYAKAARAHLTYAECAALSLSDSLTSTLTTNP